MSMVSQDVADLSAMEIIRNGEKQAMENMASHIAWLLGVVQGNDVRFGVLEELVSRLTADLKEIRAELEAMKELHREILSGHARIGALVRAAPRTSDSQQLSPHSDPEG